jgi:phasin family protein
MFNKDGESNPFSLEAQLKMYTLITNAGLQRTAELVELHMALSRDSLRDSTNGQKRLFAAADASQYLALASVLARENLERGTSYARDLNSIVTKTYTQDQAAAPSQAGKAAGRGA